ncbi:MAG: hypothetical protein GY817_09280 [bacterium]|nr:hypothetical protein [bacterium]
MKPEEILNKWADSINNGKIDLTLGLYSKNASLLPTFSEKAYLGVDIIKEYFDKLSLNKSVQVNFIKDSIVIEKLADNIFSTGGFYDWVIDSGKKFSNIKARFTFVLDLNSSTPIIHHHSSVVPR